MFGKLGSVGVFGLLVVMAGVVVIAWQNLVIAGGLALVLAGLGFVVYGMVRNLVSQLGMGGMV